MRWNAPWANHAWLGRFEVKNGSQQDCYNNARESEDSDNGESIRFDGAGPVPLLNYENPYKRG